MHIVIDCRYESCSGIGRCIRELVPRLLAYQEHRYTLLMPKQPDEIFLKSCQGRADIIRSTAQMYSLQAQLELPRIIPQCDIFWAMHYDAPLLPLKARKRMATIHDVCHLALKDEFSLPKRLYAKAMMKAVGSRYDQIITVSEFSRLEIEKYVSPGAPVEVVYNGITCYEINQPRGILYPYLLCVGNVKPHKNIARLLEAYSLYIRQAEDPLKLVVVGKREGFLTGMNGLEEKLESAGIREMCVFTGYVDDMRLAGLYRNAVAFICPSLYEGFGLPPLEAMAYGTPVIAARAASLPEVLGKASLYVDPYNKADIAMAISRITSDENLRENLIAEGREQCRRYSWDKAAKQIMERMVGLIC